MIRAAFERAIVEILDAGKTLGTGGIVTTDGLVLTATHVVGARPSVTVRFLDNTTDVATFVEAGQPDWSLFRLTTPRAVDPLPIGELDSVSAETGWDAIGFANLRGGLRGGFHGVVRREVPPLELFCEELRDKTHDEARGISGAPCFVGGEVVAMITDVLRTNGTGEIITGQIDALPIVAIKPQTVALPRTAGDKLPWELVFMAPLQQVTAAERVMAATKARIKNPADSPSLPRQVARRMIGEGVDTTARVMKQIERVGPEVIDAIMALADTLWVRGTAAESFAAITRANGVGVIKTERDNCAIQHLMRAYEIDNADTRYAWSHVVVRGTGEPPATVLRKTYDALRDSFPGDDAAVRRKVGKQHVTALILGTPRAEVVTALRTDFPNLVIVFMSRSTSTGSAAVPAGLIVVEPEVTPAEEIAVEQTNSDARDNL